MQLTAMHFAVLLILYGTQNFHSVCTKKETRALTYQAQSAENGFLRLVSILQLFVLSQLAFLICPEGSVEMCAHHPSYTIT